MLYLGLDSKVMDRPDEKDIRQGRRKRNGRNRRKNEIGWKKRAKPRENGVGVNGKITAR